MSHKQVPIITLDGPSGTGKGTVCHMVASRLNWHVLDSGAIYRVLAWAARQRGIADTAITELVSLAQCLKLRFETSDDKESKVFLDEEDITQLIRTEQCGQDASKIAAIPEVRQALLERQRAFGALPGLVTDGRDMGTVVFPDAFIKIYLDANQEERANRRYLQLKSKGINVSLAQVVEELVKRDVRDTQREHAPLKPAEDAVHIDTTGLTIVQVFDRVLDLVNIRLNN
jgi:CMP/dCMP kinase